MYLEGASLEQQPVACDVVCCFGFVGVGKIHRNRYLVENVCSVPRYVHYCPYWIPFDFTKILHEKSKKINFMANGLVPVSQSKASFQCIISFPDTKASEEVLSSSFLGHIEQRK